MKTASIREVRHDFSRVLEWVTNGEEVTITKRNQAVARLVPTKRIKVAQAKLPDVTARLQKVFGRKVISDKTMLSILDATRANY